MRFRPARCSRPLFQEQQMDQQGNLQSSSHEKARLDRHFPQRFLLQSVTKRYGGSDDGLT